ncbi:MAG: hypothetical protein AAF657_39785, partial [Acidobacteriota bacterium]
MAKKFLLCLAAGVTLACGSLVLYRSVGPSEEQLAAAREEERAAKIAERRKTIKQRMKTQMAAAATGVDLSKEGDRSALGYAGWFREQRVFPGESYPDNAIRDALAHTAAQNLNRQMSPSEPRTSAGLPRAGVTDS